MKAMQIVALQGGHCPGGAQIVVQPQRDVSVILAALQNKNMHRIYLICL
jgi:hypothetical protein